MLQPTSITPSGPRASRQSARLNASRQPVRGGIQKRSGTPLQVDKDGDLDMGADAKTRSERAVRSGRGTAIRGLGQIPRLNTPEPLTNRVSARPARARIDTAAIQKAVLRGMGSNEPVAKTGSRGARVGPRARESAREARESLERIAVFGLKQSKAANNKDGGISDLLAFLERKATIPDASARDSVKIRKVCLTSQIAGHQQPLHPPSRISGPLSFQAKYLERRPRYAATASG